MKNSVKTSPINFILSSTMVCVIPSALHAKITIRKVIASQMAFTNKVCDIFTDQLSGNWAVIVCSPLVLSIQILL